MCLLCEVMLVMVVQSLIKEGGKEIREKTLILKP